MILIPQQMTLVQRAAYNGARGDSRDPLYIDAAQTYLIAGKPWGEPVAMGPVCVAPTSGGEHVLVTRWLPMTLRPGCCGVAWRGRFCKLDRSGADHPNTPIAVDCYAWDALSTPLNPFQSVLSAEQIQALPNYPANNDNEINAALRAVQGAPIVGPDPLWYPVPPEVPTPGIVQLDPVLSFRTVVLRFQFVGIGVGHLVVQPLVTAASLQTLSP